MQTESPKQLDQILQSLELMIDTQDNQVHDDADQFSRIHKRFDRLEKQLRHFAEQLASPADEEGEYDWKTQKERILAQYGVDPSQNKQLLDDPLKPAGSASDLSEPETPEASHDSKPAELQMTVDQEQQVEQLKQELREKIRQAEVELSIKQAKLEQQEARMEEKQAELERMSARLKQKESQTGDQQSLGVLGRLKKHLSFLSFSREEAVKDEENRRLESLMVTKRSEARGMPLDESPAEPTEQVRQVREDKATFEAQKTKPSPRPESKEQPPSQQTVASKSELDTVSTLAPESAARFESEDTELESRLSDVLETSKLVDYLRDEAPSDGPADAVSDQPLTSEAEQAAEEEQVAERELKAETVSTKPKSNEKEAKQLRITHLKSSDDEVAKRETSESETESEAVASSESIIAELTALKEAAEESREAESKQKFDDVMSGLSVTAPTPEAETLEASEDSESEPDETSKSESLNESAPSKKSSAQAKRQARKKRNKRRNKRRK